MTTSLVMLYKQIEEINSQMRILRHFEDTFDTVHKTDTTAQVVEALAVKTSSALINVNRNMKQLAQLMAVEVPNANATKVLESGRPASDTSHT